MTLSSSSETNWLVAGKSVNTNRHRGTQSKVKAAIIKNVARQENCVISYGMIRELRQRDRGTATNKKLNAVDRFFVGSHLDKLAVIDGNMGDSEIPNIKRLMSNIIKVGDNPAATIHTAHKDVENDKIPRQP